MDIQRINRQIYHTTTPGHLLGVDKKTKLDFPKSCRKQIAVVYNCSAKLCDRFAYAFL